MAGQNNHRSAKRGSNKGPRLSYAAQNQQEGTGRAGAQDRAHGAAATRMTAFSTSSGWAMA